MRTNPTRALALLAVSVALAACPGRAPVGTTFCALPGETPANVTVPPGFCARRFAVVQHARVMRFAPGGELFVASPNTPTSGYGNAGPEPARIAYIADDDHDGRGDAVVTFLPGLDACHALLFDGAGHFYYSSGARILRMDYAPGQRVASGGAIIASFADDPTFVHWPHTLDVADDGTVYVSRGSDVAECATPRPVHGAILALDGSPHGRVVARGLRNPMYLRCQRGRGRCYANELTGDFWDALGATEKLIPIRDGDDWGYPCCVQQNVPAPDTTPTPDCSGLAQPARTVPLHETPFGMDFEPGAWPAPWTHALFVAMHGQFLTWHGARLVAIATDATTGEPRADVPVADFAVGWDDDTLAHGRPSDVVFAPDGRLFVANDITGEIIWIAPVGLRPAR